MALLFAALKTTKITTEVIGNIAQTMYIQLSRGATALCHQEYLDGELFAPTRAEKLSVDHGGSDEPRTDADEPDAVEAEEEVVAETPDHLHCFQPNIFHSTAGFKENA